MRKTFSLIILVFCFMYFHLLTYPQQGRKEGQDKPSSSLPTPSINKIVPVETETMSMSLRPQMVTHRCQNNSLKWGDFIEWGNKSYAVVKQEPKIGDKAQEYPKEPIMGTGIGSTRSDDFRFIHRVIFGDIKYEVALNEKDAIRRINTEDSKFKTPEGIRVGDSLEKALKASNNKPVGVKSCLYYLKLESKWNAVFLESDILKDGTLSPNATVAFFFKED